MSSGMEEMEVLVTVPVRIRAEQVILELCRSGGSLAQLTTVAIADWNDGRYPFATEMVLSGISRSVEEGIRKVVEGWYQNILGNQMITNENGSQTSASSMEAEKLMKQLQSVRAVADGIKVEVK
jgi:hypothetical protein